METSDPTPFLSSSDQYPVPGERWDRYEIIGLIGQGGMGRVYKAFDPRLKRFVALKFLRSEEPEMLKRFLQEARAQAKIKHEHVCEIYEIGELEGHAYIAMQYIDGQSLSELKSSLTQKQVVEIIQKIADALHSAHRLGMIHRDVKPANILLERKEGDSFHPYILDFGLARDVQSDSLTVTGTLVGTPQYMAPERLLENPGSLDSRVDIYSLGVTLYEGLTQRHPFEEQSMVNLLVDILNREPIPLRKVNPEIPEELETIVLKAMEKDPSRRYSTARELSEDLRRFLEGEAILARPATFTYRVLKKAKKHRALSVISILSFLSILVLSSIAVHTQWQAARKARLSEEFGRQTQKIEAVMRYAYLLPLHNTRVERRIVFDLIAQIEKTMQEGSDVAKGPGHYAIGRGYLSLHDYEKARYHLEQAWKENWKTPEVAYSLGLVLGELYRKELENAERVTNQEMKKFLKDKIAKEFADPAQRFLNAGKGVQLESPDYPQALLAFYRQDYQEALNKSSSSSRIPWWYEGDLLTGRIYTVLGNQHRDSGNNQQALELYNKAEEAFRIGASKGSSDPEVYLAACGLHAERMHLLGAQSEVSPQKDFESGMEQCKRALVADPSQPSALTHMAFLHQRWADYRIVRGEDPRPILEKAIDFADQSLKLKPDQILSLVYRGTALRTWAEYEMDHGGDPTPLLQKASETYQKALGIAQDVLVFKLLADVCWTWGEYELYQGLDPRNRLQKAFDNYDRALSLNANLSVIHNNKGVAAWSYAEYLLSRGIDPRVFFEKAITSLQNCIRINPAYSLAYNNLGGVYKTKGDWEELISANPMPSFERAIENYHRALNISPDYSYAWSNLAGAYQSQADYQFSNALNPENSIREGLTAAEQALRHNADFAEPHIIKASLFTLKGMHEKQMGLSPNLSFAKAKESINRAEKIDPQNALVYYACARLLSARSEEDKALRMLELAKGIRKDWAKLYGLEGELWLRKAKKTGKKDFAVNAVRAFEESLRLNSFMNFRYKKQLKEAEAFLK